MKKILILCPLDIHNTEVMMSKVNEEFQVQSNVFFAGFGFNLLKAMGKSAPHEWQFINMYMGVAADEKLKTHFDKEGFFVGLLDYNEKPDEIWAFDLSVLSAQELALNLDAHNKYHTTFNSTITKTFDNYEDLKAEMRRVRDEL